MMISKLIISLLKKHRRVALRNIGSFHIVNIEPAIDETTRSISPPKKEFVISYIKEGDPELVPTAFQNSLISKEEATLLKIDISLKALELSRNKEVYIVDVGQILLTDEVLTFEPASSFLQHLEPFLPSVSLPEPRIQDEKQPTSAPISVDTLSESRKSSVGLRVEKRPNYFFKDYGLPLLLFVLGIMALVFLFKTCFNGERPLTPTNPEAVEYERAPDDIDPLAVDIADEIFTNPQLNKYKDILTQEIIDSGCQIVVGTFNTVSNAEKLSQSLIEKGFEISMSDFQGQTRVILTFDCSQHDLDEYYQEIRTNISPRAWYLVPDYEPEI